MPRKRQVDPAFFSDEMMVSLPLEAAWLYLGLWFWADDRGNVEDSPRQWRLWVFPDRPYSVEQVSGWRSLLMDEKRILPYSVNGKSYFHIPTLLLHQSIQHPSKPRCPPPPGSILTEDSLRTHEKEGELTEPSRIGTRVESNRVKFSRTEESKTSASPPLSPTAGASLDLQGWLDRLASSDNHVGILGEMITTLRGGEVSLSRLASVLGRVYYRDAGNMAGVIWKNKDRQISGDFLSYVEMAKGGQVAQPRGFEEDAARYARWTHGKVRGGEGTEQDIPPSPLSEKGGD
ncbi:hypothetical protein LCGC14_0634400 [marine sediment metagenome]|uniref:Uncharacterized protein n=1 Tax=marine sediment metagenome TaxID=412755 RepID=A0A0F9U9I4_9ZZZZ